jgi:cytoskeletal protein RodZ
MQGTALPPRLRDRSTTGVGDQLRRAREAKGLSLADVGAVTRISVRALEAIEGERFHLLPGGVFSRSYVQDYARAVGLDGRACLRACRGAFEATETSAPPAGEFDWPRPALAITIAAILAAVLGFAVVALG